MAKKEHIDFNLDFLDKEPVAATSSTPGKVAGSAVTNATAKLSGNAWKIIGGALVVVVIIFWFGSSDSGSTAQVSSGSSGGNSNNSISVGDYECSQSHSRRAEELQPDETEGSRIDSMERSLKARANDLEDLEYEIDNTYVDEYSQYSIDEYNDMVAEYNSGIEELQADLASFERRTKQYNAQVDEYNDYLEANCDAT